MTRARYQQVSLQDTPYYHCISRCVRRAYLCGDDPVSGKNFDHRKRWLVTRIKQLAAQFSVDICAYAVMSNHYHLVVYVNEAEALSWGDEEVIARWTELFPQNAALIDTLYNNRSTKAARKKLAQQVSLWRERLTDISWFMRCLNESIARQANREDQCTGRFWEGRFKSLALLDQQALVTCMAYVDLNPIRAGVSESLETSDFTSIQERLIHHAKKVKNRSYRQHRMLTRRNSRHLVGHQVVKQAKLKSMPTQRTGGEAALPISQQNYFELLEATSKALSQSRDQNGKAIPVLDEKHKTLNELGIHGDAWMNSISEFHKHYAVAAGSEASLLHFHASRIKSGVVFKHPDKWIRGIHSARLLYDN